MVTVAIAAPPLDAARIEGTRGLLRPMGDAVPVYAYQAAFGFNGDRPFTTVERKTSDGTVRPRQLNPDYTPWPTALRFTYTLHDPKLTMETGRTYQVIVDLNLFNSYLGLSVPLIASATATLLFRQFFLTIPDEYVEAAKLDGAGPLRFFRDILLPLSVTNIAALAVILFIYGWNQYLWPLLIVNDRSMETIVVGLAKMTGHGDAQNAWNVIMATAVLALLPPVGVVVLMQRWFIKGLTETEK
jgi:hypothetical protein